VRGGQGEGCVSDATLAIPSWRGQLADEMLTVMHFHLAMWRVCM
jgi:hypothetical protein